MLPKKHKINKKLFLIVVSNSKNFSSPLFNLKVSYNCPKNKSFAFVASSRISKKAVERNKLKRQVGAATGSLLSVLKENVCAIVFLKKEAVGKKYAQIKEELSGLYKKAKII